MSNSLLDDDFLFVIDAYNDITELLTEIYLDCKCHKPELDKYELFRCFDIVLGACLIGPASCDGTLCEAEEKFIKTVPEYGSFIDAFNDYVKANGIDLPVLDWDTLKELFEVFDKNATVNLVSFIATSAKASAKVLIDTIAFDINLLGSRQILLKLTSLFMTILAGLCEVDGDTFPESPLENPDAKANNEYMVAKSLFNAIFLDPICEQLS